MNPAADRWNPGWQQFMLNQQRAQAGGNRHGLPLQQPIQQFVGARPVVERNGRRNNAPAQNPVRRNNQHRHNNNNNNNNNNHNNHNNNINNNLINQNPIRRDNRVPTREVLTRDDLERIETMSRKNLQTRTALEYDNHEDQCWLNIQNNIEKECHQFSTSSTTQSSGDVFIPSEDNICSNLRIENQNEVIMKTRELLINFGASEQELSDALANLEVHLRTNALEYNIIENLSNELIENAGKLAMEVDELDAILRRIDKIRLQK